MNIPTTGMTVGQVSLQSSKMHMHMSWYGILVFFCLLFLWVTPTYAATSVGMSNTNLVTNGLVGHWTFDGKNMTNATATDSSGNGNNGTLTNMTAASAKTIGKIGQALSFSGTSNSVNVVTSSSLNITNDISISAWIKPTTYGGGSRGRIVDSSGSGGSTGYRFAVDNANISNGFGFGINAASTLGGDYFTSNAGVITLNKWQMVTVTFNDGGNSLSFYVNGVLDKVVTLNGSIASNVVATVIGSYAIAGDRIFDGTIDDVRIYNRVLSATEIKSLYKAGGGTVVDTADRVVFITTPGDSTWTVPAGVTSIKVEAIGAGGGGGTGSAGSGGGGGAYAVRRNINVSPGSSISVSVGTGGTADTAGTDTTFNTSVVVAKGGSAGVGYSSASVPGGSSASSIPTTGAFSGGNGGGGDFSYNSGGGGGGAASYLGAGGAGGASGAAKGAAGGGGSGRGSAGGNSVFGGANGGGNDLGFGGGTSPAGDGSNGGNGIGHSAGGGAGGYSNFNPASLWPGGTGGNGAEWHISYGSGGGGGGGGSNGGGAGGVGGDGGNYGGGGGGGGIGESGGIGGNGLIVITYKVGQSVAAMSPTSNNRTGINSGLVGHWTFDGKNMTNATATDSSGSGNNGTLTNMTGATSKTIGKIGQALTLDGVDDYISVANNANLNGSQGTWLFWIKSGDIPSGNGYVSLGKTDVTGSYNGINFYLQSGSIGVQIKGPSNVGSFATNIGSVADSKWHYVGVSYISGGALRVYFDGSLVTSSTSPTFTMSSQNLRIGRSVDTYWETYKGSIDDIRIYNRILSSQEVKALYKLGAQ